MEKIDYVDMPMYTCPDGLRRSDNTVILSVAGITIYRSVEELFEWIEWSRIPGEKYCIGEPGSDLMVLWGILLEEIGIPKKWVMSELTHYDVNKEFNQVLVELSNTPVRDTEDDDSLPDWVKDVKIPKEEWDPPPRSEIKPIVIRKLNYSEINLSDFEDEDDVDSDDSDIISLSSEQLEVPDADLPYDPNLHHHGDEFISLLEQNQEEKAESTLERDDDDIESVESYTSLNIPDKELTPLENLGIDLVDNSKRSYISNPVTRRIDILWGSTIREPRNRTIAQRRPFKGG
jgi:hypothetical protein